MSHKIWTIIPAAGIGQRFGSSVPKQYHKINGKTIIEYAINPFLQLTQCHKVIITLNPADTYFKKLKINQHHKMITVQGGASRADSVLNALHSISSEAHENDWVLVHDAVRPCISKNEIQSFIAETLQDEVGGLLMAPSSDTLKSVSSNRIDQTLDREQIWRALTPQMFRFGLLMKGFSKSLNHITDESSAIEALNLKPKMIKGHPRNIKITWDSDLTFAHAIINQNNL